jgi:hypothetical protein
MGRKMPDYSMGSFWSACIASGAAFLIVSKKYHLEEGIGLLLICYVTGLFASFGYMGLKKSGDKWDSQDIFAGFFGSALALWAPVVLMLIP